jgi:hypothetical protein
MNIAVNGRRIEAEWHGPTPDQAPTLVLLHEGLGCGRAPSLKYHLDITAASCSDRRRHLMDAAFAPGCWTRRCRSCRRRREIRIISAPT